MLKEEFGARDWLHPCLFYSRAFSYVTQTLRNSSGFQPTEKASAVLAAVMPKFARNIRVLRDMKARRGVNENEILRRAYLYVARNETLPPQVRYQAQLQLNTFDKYTRPTTVKNRCTTSGRGRGIISEFGLCRVSVVFLCAYLSD